MFLTVRCDKGLASRGLASNIFVYVFRNLLDRSCHSNQLRQISIKVVISLSLIFLHFDVKYYGPEMKIWA